MPAKFLRDTFRAVGRAVCQTIDGNASVKQIELPGPKKVEWVRNLPYFGMHAACLLVFVVGFSWAALAVCVGLYFARMFAITGFYHRYFSHKTFKTSRAFQFVMAIWGLTAIQRGPLWWAAHHRHHHRHSDEHPDLHSPKQHGMVWSHMFWFTTEAAFGTNQKSVHDLAKYPELRFVDRFDTLIYLAFGAALFGVGVALDAIFPTLGTSGWQIFVWGFFLSTVLTYHGTYTINSLSHKFGKQRYKTGDDSRNNIWLALLTLGEGWHNNHHHYQSSVQQGFYWYEIDITYYILRAMSWTGLIWDLRGVPEKKLNANRMKEGAPSMDEAAAAARPGHIAARKKTSIASSLGKKAHDAGDRLTKKAHDASDAIGQKASDTLGRRAGGTA
jgi:stearoyl-CoA desaturase (delta-9 desaturase)